MDGENAVWQRIADRFEAARGTADVPWRTDELAALLRGEDWSLQASKESRMTDIEIDVPEQLRDRVARAAECAGQTEQEFMLAAIVEKVARSEGLLGGAGAGTNQLSV